MINGSREWFRVYEAVVIWDGVPLLGMGMLAGFRLTLDAVDGGAVRISRIRSSP